MERTYEGPAIDVSWQDIKDRPFKGKGETVDVTPDESGSVTTEGVEGVFGPSEDAKRAHELLPAFREMGTDELRKFAMEYLNEGGDKARALAAIFALAIRSGRYEEFIHWLEKYESGDIDSKTFGESAAYIIAEA